MFLSSRHTPCAVAIGLVSQRHTECAYYFLKHYGRYVNQYAHRMNTP
jgi:hypothetical protein